MLPLCLLVVLCAGPVKPPPAKPPHHRVKREPDPPVPQWPWRFVCGQIGWANEYAACRARKA
jgi:hypothetical protein